MSNPYNTIAHVEESDLSQTIKQLNDDSLEIESRMSALDMKTRLNIIEIPAILGIDNLIQLGVFPNDFLQLTRQKKRLAVSKGGMGRSEIVRIAVGTREDEKNQFINPKSPVGLLNKKNNE